MPWRHFISGLQSIFGLPGTDGIVLDSVKCAEFKKLLEATGLHNLRSKDLADGYLTVVPSGKRRGRGVYYTPWQVVEFILDQVCPAPRISVKGIRDPFPDDFRILEPACGAGYFLLSGYSRLRNAYEKAGFKPVDAVRNIITDRLAAVDIDGRALLVALAALIQEAGDEITRAVAENPIRVPFFRADFLDKNHDNSQSWFGKLLSKGFSAIVGNPPYISFYAKRAESISENDKRYYRENYLSGKGRINTYCLFTERAFNLLSPAGTLGFIIPNTLLIMKSYEGLRRFLLKEGWIKCVVDLSLKVFPEVEVPTCVIAVEKRDRRALPFPRKVMTGRWENARGKAPCDFDHIEQSKFEELPYTMFNIQIKNADSDVIDAIEKNSQPLGNFFEVRDGINPANIAGKLIVKSMKRLDPPYKHVVRGKDVAPYHLSWDHLWIRYDPSAANRSQGEYCFLREERIFKETPKILSRQTANRLIAAWDTKGYYALNSVHVTLPLNNHLNLKCLLALYNSKLLNYYYRLVFPDTERVFPQVKTVNVEKLPIPQMNGNTKYMEILVDKVLDSTTSGESNKNREQWIKELDAIIYNLYGLNPDQIARIESSPYTLSLKSG